MPGLLVADNPQNTGLTSIMAHWFTNVKHQGLVGIPTDDRLPGMAAGTTNFGARIELYGTDTKTAQLSRKCLRTIHGFVRKYNRNLFIQLIDSDPE